MATLKTTAKKSWILLPLIGILAFVCLYIIATFFYPGGSYADKKAKGFSWAQNYWCNLLNEKAINGQYNAARPIAMVAMFVLCLALISFWYIFPREAGLSKRDRLIIQMSGTLSMVTGIFIFTHLHDAIINLAGCFGLIAISRIFVALYKLQWINLFRLGIFNLALIILNNILYYGNGLMLYLPIVQKFTFLFFLLWVCLMNLQIFIKVQSALQNVVKDEMQVKQPAIQ